MIAHGHLPTLIVIHAVRYKRTLGPLESRAASTRVKARDQKGGKSGSMSGSDFTWQKARMEPGGSVGATVL